MLSTFRRQAAILAVYLAQFETSSHAGGPTALSEDEKQRYRRDYRRAVEWAGAREITDDDVAALTRMRLRYGFGSKYGH